MCLSRFGSLIVPACRSGGGYSSYCRSGVGPGCEFGVA
ncbi:fructose-bisphosphate aldolase [Pseudomonas mandelii JR-1]|uniref:Fructose-bisphosphate aldolase n=1 Tax=Pseudomonas mandelii JR-1 TaxID=1147786 RepID=A0A024EEI2_9PSED|nr:fructose-bisphosphate aldolase [Pseudomonas mandelii JR-1]